MILHKIKEVINTIKFAKKAFTKGGFRLVTNYISGLISLAKKTVKKIASECADIKHQSSLNRILNKAKFKKKELEKRYLKKIKYLFKNAKISLIIDDTLVERNGKHIELTQKHHDHNTNSYINGHQFFTAIIHTGFLQLPLFPELYSPKSNSKIEMAKNLVDKLIDNKIRINNVLFDSWYSDKDLIKKCRAMGARVICCIKTNRILKIGNSSRYRKLSFISKRISSQKLKRCEIENKIYAVWSSSVNLHKLPSIRLIISRDISKKDPKNFHLISTNVGDSPEEIISTYKIRWNIETFHRDMKQNLGFADAFFRKESGIVRHSIFVILAFAVLNLIMYRRGQSMTIGECCEYLRNKSTTNVVHDIVVIEDKQTRLNQFEEVFISES